MSAEAEMRILWAAQEQGFRDIEQAFRGVDQAMGEVEQGSEDLARANREVEESSRQATQAMKEQRTNYKGLVTSMSGVVTSGLAVYGMYERIRNAQISFAAASKEVHETQVTLTSYQNRLTKAIARYGEASEQVREIEERVKVQKELLSIKMDRERIASEQVTKSYILTATGIIPTVLSAYSNMMVAIKAFTMAKTAENTAEAISVGLKTYGVGLAVAMAATVGFLVWQSNQMANAQKGVNEAMRQGIKDTETLTEAERKLKEQREEAGAPPPIPSPTSPARTWGAPTTTEPTMEVRTVNIHFDRAIVEDEEQARKYARIIRDEIEDSEKYEWD